MGNDYIMLTCKLTYHYKNYTDAMISRALTSCVSAVHLCENTTVPGLQLVHVPKIQNFMNYCI